MVFLLRKEKERCVKTKTIPAFTRMTTSNQAPGRFCGFTLAEVLITLGIIGVVAAMTMPTLINSTNGAQYKTAFKKALSVMSQAVSMNVALNDYDLSDTIRGLNPAAGENGTVLDGQAYTIYSIFRKGLNVTKVATGADFNLDSRSPQFYPVITAKDSDIEDMVQFMYNHNGTEPVRPAYIDGVILGAAAPIDGLKIASSIPLENYYVDFSPGNVITTGSSGSAWDDESTFLFLNDGITLIFDNRQSACRQATANLGDHYCFAFIDINGQKGPNRFVECDEGSQEGTPGADDYSCTVSNPTDIYPIAMYNQTIIPASAAARAVLFAKGASTTARPFAPQPQ